MQFMEHHVSQTVCNFWSTNWYWSRLARDSNGRKESLCFLKDDCVLLNCILWSGFYEQILL